MSSIVYYTVVSFINITVLYLQTDAEFLAHHSCYEERKSTEPKKFFHASSYESYPEDMDWRNKDAVSPVQDQVAAR